jgi:hypothetical protein
MVVIFRPAGTINGMVAVEYQIFNSCSDEQMRNS